MPYRPTGKPRGRPPYPGPLTPAEERVLDLVREGLPNAEIAARLGISVETVKSHVSTMLSKLQVGDRQTLAAWTPAPESAPVRRWGIIGAGFAKVGATPAAAGIAGVALAGTLAGLAALAVFAFAARSEDDLTPTPVILGTGTPLLPAGTATALVPTSPTPTPSPTFAPTATPIPVSDIPFHPPGTRTGVDVVDRVLDAIERQDGAAYRSLLVYQPVPCVTRQTGIGPPPLCHDGEPEGTQVDAIVSGNCEGAWLRPEETTPGMMTEFLTPRLRLYGAVAFPGGSERFQDAEYALVVFQGDGSRITRTIPISKDGVTQILWGCGGPPVADFADLASDGMAILAPAAPSRAWSALYGGAQDDYTGGVVASAEGDIYIAVASSGQPFGATGGSHSVDVFVGLLSPNGQRRGVYRFGGRGLDEPADIAVGPDGTIYVAGRSRSPSIGDNVGAGEFDVMLARLDPVTGIEWIRLVGTAENDEARSLAVTEDGSIYVAGRTFLPSASGGGDEEALLLKFSPDGEVLWSRSFGEVAHDRLLSAAAMPDGSVIVGGVVNQPDFTVAFGDDGADGLVARYSADGEVIWSRLIDAGRFEEVAAVAVGAGYILAAGTTWSPNDENVADLSDVMVLGFDPDGKEVWRELVPGSVDEWAVDLAVMPDTHFYVVGRVDHLEDGRTTSPRTNGMALLWFDSGGRLEWSRELDGTHENVPTGLAPDGLGGVLLTGWTRSEAFEGSLSQGKRDVFLAKYR